MAFNNSPISTPVVYTVAEFAAITKWKISTVRKQLHMKKIGYIKLGRSVRIPQSELQRLLKEGFRPAVSGDVKENTPHRHGKDI